MLATDVGDSSNIHSDRKSVNKSKNCQQFPVTNFSVLTCFEIIFPTLVNLHSNSGSFVPKLVVNLEINLGTFKFTISMFNYGQHVRIWIIEIDHRTSLFLDSDLYSELTK